MNELSGQPPHPPNDGEAIRLGFCPHCHCPESRVLKTRKIEAPSVRDLRGKRMRVVKTRIIRYRRCTHCGESFRTTETSD